MFRYVVPTFDGIGILERYMTKDEFRESQHPRGQPENKGEFAKASGGGGPQTREDAQKIGKSPKGHETEHLQRALELMNNKHRKDRPFNVAIRTELLLRGVVPRVGPKGEPKQMPRKQPPVKPPEVIKEPPREPVRPPPPPMGVPPPPPTRLPVKWQKDYHSSTSNELRYDYTRMKELYGKRENYQSLVIDSDDGDNISMMQGALWGLPPEIKRMMGKTIIRNMRTIPDARANAGSHYEVKPVAVAGYCVPAWHPSGINQVLVFDTCRAFGRTHPVDVDRVVYHEMGHALDARLRISDSPKFRQVCDEVKQRIMSDPALANIAYGGKYYFQNHSEMFAETFALMYGKHQRGFGSTSRGTLEMVLEPIMAEMKHQIFNYANSPSSEHLWDETKNPLYKRPARKRRIPRFSPK